MSESDLTGARLHIPTLHSEPLPVAVIKPSPCTLACPAGINVKAYVSLIAEGRNAEALEQIRRRCPLPAVCGRICHHPCEKACRRARYDEPLAIRALKRFVADHELDYPAGPAPPVTRAGRIAIIGSGPAGLTAAYDLRLAGYGVTIFESEAEAGGMLRYGIADYRLPAHVLDAEIGVIRDAGVDIVTGTRIGRDMTFAELRALHAATLVAVGAQRGRRLGLAGEDETPEVEDALSFLRRVKGGDRTRAEDSVAVIGGGSTAVEAARTVLRLGASSVEILYRRYRDELLADDEEIAAAESEGIRFRFLVAPRELVKEHGKLVALECRQVGLGEPDASGRRRPLEIPGSEFRVKANRILAAIGQEADFEFLPVALAPAVTERGRVKIDGATAMTSLEGVFAAGDAVTGPATVIDAIAAGHRAADSIRHYLEEGTARIADQQPERRAAIEYELPDPEPLRAARIHEGHAHPGSGDPFSEVELAFTEEEARAEATRCLRCGPCGECRTCAATCSRRHIMVRREDGEAFLFRVPQSLALSLPADAPTPAEIVGTDGRTVRSGIRGAAEVLPVRSILEASRCRACGRCVEVCPFDALSIGTAAAAARLDPALCRGCGLCAAACPTHAARQSALSPEWWSDRVDAALAAIPDRESLVVLACQRRAGSVETAFEEHGVHADVVRFRCAGQVDAGMLLELSRQPFSRVLVAGCSGDRCRFTAGARDAMEQVERARTMLRALGLDDGRIVADWSRDRAGDRLEPAIARAAEGGH